MIPRLDISFTLKNQKTFWFGDLYSPQKDEFLINHARSGIVMALHAVLPNGGKVGVVAYNCYTVSNAVVTCGCTPVFVDVTEDLHINVQHLQTLKLDVLIVTNLFGIHNDIHTIQSAQPNAIIIVDNAHGYGLPVEGDFTVYSINQGKFPALGEGGILWVNNEKYRDSIEQQYTRLSTYSVVDEINLFLTMLFKAWMHTSFVYSLITLPMKKSRKEKSCIENVIVKRMARGVNRIYKSTLSTIKDQIFLHKTNAQYVASFWQEYGLGNDVWYGENAFMLIGRHTNPLTVKQIFAKHGLEVATHFVKSIEWAKEFGYTQGQCPITERLTQELIMIPTYKSIKL